MNNTSELIMDEESIFMEVEDIMCDQRIISAELNVDIKTTSSAITISATRFRVAVAVFARAVLPAVVGVYYAYLRNQKTVVESVRRQLLPAVFAFVANSISRSLSSVQWRIAYPLRVHKSPPAITSDDNSPEKSVECCILVQPCDSDIRADVIFIHGLHGSLEKTWKQGLWKKNGRHKMKNESLARSKSMYNLENRPENLSLKRTVSDTFNNPPSKFARTENQAIVEESTQSNFENVDEDKLDSFSKCWPQDWLPMDCPGVRVIALNYTTDPYLWRPVWMKKKNRTSMVERSKEMIEHLLEIGVGKHPIIWVGHSKGGLFIKQIIVHSWETCFHQPHLKNLYIQTKGIMFYSVPHRGSTLADFNLPFLSRSVELTEVQRNCSFVLNLHRKFLEICENSSFSANIFSFIETSLTLMAFIYLRIVALESADPGIGIKWGVPLDHREICKPANRHCILYQELVKLINAVVTDRLSIKCQIY